MISRISVLSKSLSLGQAVKLVKFQNNGVRYHHVISAGSLHGRLQLDQMKRCPSSRSTSIEQTLCTIPGMVQHRNFSLSALRAATPVTATAAAAAASDSTVVAASNASASVEILSIPDAPISDATVALVNQLAANGEPTLASLGLGGSYTPIAWLQNGLEFLHVTCDLPWWGAIAVSTILIRICLTPLVVITQRNAANMQNTMPEMQELQLKVNEARACGNALEYAQANQELMVFMKGKGLNPIKNMLVPMAQMPIFLSYFIGLRRMVNAPVESMQTGGLYWFTDLTVADPYYLLPLITCSTLALTIHLGTEVGTTAPMGGNNTLQYVMKGIPIVVFPFIMNFPAALAVYWASSNFCSLIQGAFFRIPKVRAYFNIPQKLDMPKPAAKKKVGFVKNVKGAWSNLKLSREIEDRRRLDQIQFERAGTAPIVRTYKFDPTNVKKAQ